MIERIIHPDSKSDAYNLIRETIKMSTAVRQTLQKKEQEKAKQSSELPDNLFKKLRVGLNQQTFSFDYFPPVRKTIEEEVFFKLEKNPKSNE